MFVLGLWAFWSVVVAVAGSDRSDLDWITVLLAGFLAAGMTVIIIAVTLRLLGVGGFLFTITATLVAGLWQIIGPIPTIIIGGAAAYLLWRYRFQIAERVGVQVPERAASSADTSSAAASNQDSNSGTVK